MFVFRQRISEEEKWKFISIPIVFCAVWLPLVLVGIIRDGEMGLVLTATVIIFTPILLLGALPGLYYLEWFCVYSDRIEARTVYGIKNIVYFRDVQFVEELQIKLTTRGVSRAFYIFHDGRQCYNNQAVLPHNSCYNKKKYSFRIRKTPELENYIRNTLCFEITPQK